MSKKERKISILDYLILLLIGAFFCIVYFYSSIIWPREEKFKTVDRSRMERIDDAQKLYYSLTNDYNEDGRVLFSMMEAIKDTLNGNAFFEGEKKIVLAKKNKKYIVNSIDKSNADSILVNESASKSFEFSEGVKLFSNHIFKSMNFKEPDSDELKAKIQNMIINNLIDFYTSEAKISDTYKIEIREKQYLYSIAEYENFVNSNVYAVSDVFYKSLIDGKVLNNEDLENVTYMVSVPPGFKNRLDTTFTKPIKIEQFYEDSIYSVRILNLDPTDNFIDSNKNQKKDDDENYYDIIYLNSSSLKDYAGEDFVDSNNNQKWDQGELYKDLDKNGKYTYPKESYLGILPNQDIIYSVLVDNEILELPTYKYQKYIKEGKITKESVKNRRDVNFKVVSRKKIDMDYFSNVDTLTVDSLYSAINSFKHGYDQKDLFEIDITRFENESYKIILDSKSVDNLMDNYESSSVVVSLPLVSSSMPAIFYYQKMDPPNIEIKSPVPSNQNWTYWQEINLVSINDIDKSDYSMSSFSLPTPFSFYSGGNKDKIVDHTKSWID